MVKAYSLERVQQQLREAALLRGLPSDCAPLCCTLSAGGRIFLASSQRSIAMFDVEWREWSAADTKLVAAVAPLSTVGVPQSVLYNECGKYVTTIEATYGAGHVPATEVFAYVGLPAASVFHRQHHQQQEEQQQNPGVHTDGEQESEHPWLRSTRICLVDVENVAKENEAMVETGSSGGASGGAVNLPQRRRVGPTVHRFPVSGSLPAIAVCPTSCRLAVGDAGTIAVYDYVSSEDRFVAERRLALPFLATEVAVLAGRTLAAAGDSRLLIAWSRQSRLPTALSPYAGRTNDESYCSGKGPGGGSSEALFVRPACAGSHAVSNERPPSVILPSMLRRLHDRQASAFELVDGDAESVPTPDVIGSAQAKLVLYKRFDNDQELHSLALLPVAGVYNEPSEAIAFVSSKHVGYLYAVSEGRAQPLCDFTYVSTSFKVLLSSSMLTVCTTSGIEVYTNKVCPKQERDLFNQICADIKYPVLIAMKNVKGLVHCIANSSTTCYFTDHWEAFANPAVASLGAEMLLLSQELLASSISSAVQVAAEGLLALRSILSALGTSQKKCDVEGERVIKKTQLDLCLLIARILMMADDRGVRATDDVTEVPLADHSTRESSVIALYDMAGVAAIDVSLDNCLEAGSSCAARVALRLLFRRCMCGVPQVDDVPSLAIAKSILSLVAVHCPASLNHAFVHLMQNHQLLKEKATFVMSCTDAGKEADVYGTLCAALEAFYVGQAEDTQAVIGDAKLHMAGKLATALASHPHVLIAQARLTDFAQYLRSLHTDLFVTVLLELVSEHSLAFTDVLNVLNSSCGLKSYDKKLYLEALVERASRKSAHLQDPQLAKELCHLLMEALSNTTCSGTHLARQDAYCITQITTELARYRSPWLNEPTLYPPTIHQMCVHKFGAKLPYAASKSSESRVTVVGRWLCILCHADLLKLQGLLCSGLMTKELVEITVRELLGNTSSSSVTPWSSAEEPAAALSLQLLSAVTNWIAAVESGDTAAQQEAIGPDLLALVVSRCPAVISSVLHSLPQSCAEPAADLIEAVLFELGKWLTTNAGASDGLLKALQDVMKLACNLMSFDRLLTALPSNGSVAYFLPYLEHCARLKRPQCATTEPVKYHRKRTTSSFTF